MIEKIISKIYPTKIHMRVRKGDSFLEFSEVSFKYYTWKGIYKRVNEMYILLTEYYNNVHVRVLDRE